MPGSVWPLPLHERWMSRNAKRRAAMYEAGREADDELAAAAVLAKAPDLGRHRPAVAAQVDPHSLACDERTRAAALQFGASTPLAKLVRSRFMNSTRAASLFSVTMSPPVRKGPGPLP